MERGVYANHKRGSQAILFDGMQWGNITPTDIDAVIEYKDRKAVFVEVKYRDKDVPIGQRLALQRTVDNYTAAGKNALAIVVEHDVADCDAPVHLRECMVRELYHGSQKSWRAPKVTITAFDAIDAFIGG